MKLEHQCCTLHQAKRLKELGLEQISYFVWGENAKVLTEAWSIEGVEDNFYSAFTVAELGKINREDIRTYRTGDYWCAYVPTEEGMRMHPNTFKTEAELRADILITDINYNKHYIDEVNNRLTE